MFNASNSIKIPHDSGKTNRAPRRPGYIGHLCKIANQLTSHEVVQGDHYAGESGFAVFDGFCAAV